jgi:hypothetical protein
MSVTSTAQDEDQTGVKEYAGYVAFLDVLGFRAFVSSTKPENDLTAYVNTVDRAIQDPKQKLQYVIFSDSVIVNSTKDDNESFEAIIQACAKLFAEFLQTGIALRGAIAYGSFYRSSMERGTFVAGRPIVEAFDYEKRQNWVGIMLCPSTIRKQKGLRQRCQLPSFEEVLYGNAFDMGSLSLPACIQWCHKIPFHKENASSLDEPTNFEGHAILPTGPDVTPLNIGQKLSNAMIALESLKSMAPDPKAQEKFKSTIEWLRNVNAPWSSITNACVALNRRLAQGK